LLLATTPFVTHPTFEIGPLAGSGGPAGGYTPAQIQEAYEFNNITFGGVVGNGSGETIAIVDAYDDPNIQADLNTFDTQFGLPATTVTRVNEFGGTSYPASDSTGGWELEESLDVEWAHAMAPGANIMLVEASSCDDNDLLAAVQYAANHANVVSMSWGGPEFSGETGYDSSSFDQAGVTFVASSGDAGAPALWPAVSPNVLSVGGTALSLGADNVWSSEVGWSGSGGGPSAYESQPSYQHGVVTQTSSARAAPDVAYDASPSTGFAVYDSVPYGGNTYDWLEVGGTSAGAPQWSALLAIADQGRALSGQPAIDTTSPQQVMSILYDNPADFHDITSGTSVGNPNYSAGPGYDYVTGLGSPIANLIVGSLDGTSTAAPDKLVLAAPTAETAGKSFNLTVTALNSSGTTDTGYVGTIHFTSSDVQAGLPADFAFTAADAGTSTFTLTLETMGTQSITATDTATSSITGTESGITVRATPQVTWSPPASIGYGTTLGTVQLDASANVPGTFTYHPAAGVILDAGAGQTLWVTFAPTDATDYTTATGTTTITVTQATPTISLTAPGGTFDGSPFPAAVTIAGVSGTPGSSLEGVSPSLTYYSGTYSNPTQLAGLTPLPGATVHAGAYTVLASFPATADYAAATGLANFTIAQATPQVTWSPAASIVYGTTLSAAQLAASANVPGTFTYHPAAGGILDAGAGQTLWVTFTPTDATDYTPATGTTTITVTQATPTISLTAPGGTFNGSPFPAAVTIAGVSGTPGSSLEGVSPSLTYYSGTYSNPTQLAGLTPLPGATVHAGAYTVLASFPATADYAAATGLANVTIAQATPQVTWSPPASIVYGTKLGTVQLDALANVPGTFTYTPATGAILDAGAGQTLSVTFTPTDATDYTTATGATTITVTQATPILKVADAGGRFDGSPFPASVTIAGVVAGVDAAPASSLDNVTPTLTYYDGSGTAGTSLGPTPPSAPGTYTVVAAFPGNVDYSAILSTPLTFTIRQGAATIALESSGGSAVYGQAVHFLATVGAVAGTPSGKVTFFDGTTRLVTVPLAGSGSATFTTSALSLGSHSITAAYSGDADFLGVQSASYSETVAQTGTEVVVVQNSVYNKKKLISVRLTAEIQPLAPGGGVPTGEVTFELVTTTKKKVKVTTLGTAAVSRGEATLTLKASKLPKQGITIVYSGDANDKASTITTPKLT
jgi:hypothetical protein